MHTEFNKFLNETVSNEGLSYLLNDKSKVLSIGKETGTFNQDGISIFKSNEGSYRFVYSKKGEIVCAVQVMSRDGKNAIVANVYTKNEYRRLALATILLKAVKNSFTNVQYSDDLSDDGKALISSEKLNESITTFSKDDKVERNRFGFDISVACYATNAVNHWSQIIADVQHISEKDFNRWDESDRKLQDFIEANRKEIETTIYRFEAMGCRYQYCGECLYDGHNLTIEIPTSALSVTESTNNKTLNIANKIVNILKDFRDVIPFQCEIKKSASTNSVYVVVGDKHSASNFTFRISDHASKGERTLMFSDPYGASKLINLQKPNIEISSNIPLKDITKSFVLSAIASDEEDYPCSFIGYDDFGLSDDEINSIMAKYEIKAISITEKVKWKSVSTSQKLIDKLSPEGLTALRCISLAKDSNGYFVHTQRWRSVSYKTKEAIPEEDIIFCATTG